MESGLDRSSVFTVQNLSFSIVSNGAIDVMHLYASFWFILTYFLVGKI